MKEKIAKWISENQREKVRIESKSKSNVKKQLPENMDLILLVIVVKYG